jgi:hypothetical protein
MKRWIINAITLIGVVALLFYLRRGFLKGEVGYKEEKAKLISGKIARVYKPSDEKIIHIVFLDSTEYSPSFYGMNDLIEAGDSLVKPSGSYRYIIYKQGRIKDSVVFQGANRFYDAN